MIKDIRIFRVQRTRTWPAAVPIHARILISDSKWISPSIEDQHLAQMRRTR
jgi:hypothetical protein